MDVVTLNKILDFLQENNKYTDRKLLSEYIELHEKYGTFDYAVDSFGDIIGCVRFNITDSGNTGEILDLAIRRDMRNSGVGRDFILRALIRFPDAKTLRFRRGVRGDNRIKEIKISNVLRKAIL